MRKLKRRSRFIVVIDSACICHIMKNKLGDLSYNHVKTGILFGFLRTIEQLFKIYKTDRFIFVWDSRHSQRKKIFPDYKVDRKKEELTPGEKEEQRLIYQQFHNIRDNLLPGIGFKNIFMQEGYEADDIMHEIVSENPGSFVMVTADHDMYQSLDHCIIHHPSSHNTFTKEDLMKEYGVTPSEWAQVKALGGCSTDCVPGIQGVGEKKAAKYLRGDLNKGKIYERIVSTEGKAIRERNEELVVLPLEGTKHFKLNWNETFSFREFIRICETYGLASFLKPKTLHKWKDNFRMV